MRKLIIFSLIAIALVFSACNNSIDNSTSIIKMFNEEQITETINALSEKFGETNSFRIERGVNQVASLWQEQDGNFEDFNQYCLDYFINDNKELDNAYNKLEQHFEVLNGYFNAMTVSLMEPLHLDIGKIHHVDNIMGAYSPSAHLTDDLFQNKLAFYIALNFPAYSLKEKVEFAENWTRKDWAYARMGDMFISRIPADLIQKAATAETNADSYIAEYNIYMGKLVDADFNTHFPENMKLITHWGLRDELKSNYNRENGIKKQEIIYNVMLRIINQDIPVEVINSDNYEWNPRTNQVYKDGKETQINKEPDTRYYHLLENFKAQSAMDAYNPLYPSYIERAYDCNMELTQKEIEDLFVSFITAPEIKQVADLIKSRIGRDLRPYDIWYDGFKARTNINEDALTEITSNKYPNPEAFENDIPRMLQTLGWTDKKAEDISSKISVDPARGAGHAWGAEMKGEKAHLRTRIPETGMDYKGYNIAVHELGHNVEQTITLYDIDYYMLHGVPNTAFTEAVAFMFQANDLKLLGTENNIDKTESDALAALDNCWSAYEIMGVSLVDMYVWQWMYENPEATPTQLKDAVINIATEVWNNYYAPVFGIENSPILAIYSHMIASPLYLANYPIGHLIEFQIEEYIEDKNFADEISRMLLQGQIIPQEWMKGAVGTIISGKPTLNAVNKALEIIK
ncbi:MAG TPA: hypothetical protein PLO05_00755 [Bacteroidales bacterium]|nr:hypothetical protein [Bacteroidales bacterium]